MQVRALSIRDFRQFKNFSLDLTYPDGHPEAGQLLRKVCLIGQNGTGKTTILNLIRDLLEQSDKKPGVNGVRIKESLYHIRFNRAEYEGCLYAVENGEKAPLYLSQKELWDPENLQIAAYLKKMPWLISFPAETVDNINRLFQAPTFDDPMQHFKSEAAIKNLVEDEKKELAARPIYDFGQEEVVKNWRGVLLEQREYWEQEMEYRYKISDALIKQNVSLDDMVKKFNSWQENHPNPIKRLAEKLNGLLKEFQLQLMSELNYNKATDLNFVKVGSLNGGEVPYAGWSTGTKQLILSATPLFFLNTEETLILMDEPERSLYPDIQRLIIDFYTELAPKAQFFYATHSPIVAASFEPWEIVELAFDKEGFVRQVPYYDTEKGRHTDHYFKDPRYLRWDTVLREHFHVQEEGNADFRTPKLMELSDLDNQIRQLKQNHPDDKASLQPLWERYEELADLLGWEIPRR